MSIALDERLRSLRQERGLSQEEVARRAGIGLKAYGELERGIAMDPHFSTLGGIARALGTTVGELVGEESEASAAGKASAPPEPGPLITRNVADSVPVSDQVEAAKYRLAQVRQIMAAWGAGELDDVGADRALEEVYAA